MSTDPINAGESEKKITLWKRLTAFLFQHRWDVVGARLVAHSTSCTTLRCQRCGRMVEYATFDKEAFVSFYRMRGCTRHLDRPGARP